MFRSSYTIRKSRRILRRGIHLYKKRSGSLLSSHYSEFEHNLKQLDQAILREERTEASRLAKNVESFMATHFPKSFFDYTKEFAGALLFALIVAFCIRQFWFELYEVPTGSMRPTIEEQDRLVVSKTTFGINFPFTDKLWLFNQNRIQRGSIIVFTTVNMDIPDSNMRYFYLFPGKKRFVKRCVARGGDRLYFYGGRIYAIDQKGEAITELSDPEWLQKMGLASIDHIPFISFDGKSKLSQPLASHVYSNVLLQQMNLPLGKMHFSDKAIEGQFYDGKGWNKEQISLLAKPRNKPVSYGDLWGINNYAMTRLLTKKEAQSFYPDQIGKGEENFFLEIRHTPNLTYPSPQMRQSEGFVIQPMITPFISLLPLDQIHLEKLLTIMTTMRFVVEDERAYRYHESHRRSQPMQFDSYLADVPNGTYEFYQGTAYAVHFGGIRTKLSKEHPLYAKKPELIQTLFNMGTNFNTLYQPVQPNQPFIPQRFAFYREGDLFVMGESLFSKEEMESFVQTEMAREKSGSKEKPYIAFIDRGAPIKEGQLDKEFIQSFGLKVPDMTLVALGDNYANSADSRDFGFVPAHNLRGAPSFTFWPPSERIGPLAQPSYPWITLPNLLVWGVAAVTIGIVVFYVRRRNKRGFFN